MEERGLEVDGLVRISLVRYLLCIEYTRGMDEGRLKALFELVNLSSIGYSLFSSI